MSGDHSLPFPRIIDCPSGTFEYCPVTGTLQWSDRMYRLHGYERGEVVPTVDLALSHVLPAERPHLAELFKSLQTEGGRYSNCHTIRDASGKQRRVLSVAEAVMQDSVISSVRGVVTDLTGFLAQETQAVADEAVLRSHEHRAGIEQAKGILRGHFRTDPDTAFRVLVRLSSRNNAKLNQLAEDFVAHAAQHGTRHAVETYFGSALPVHHDADESRPFPGHPTDLPRPTPTPPGAAYGLPRDPTAKMLPKAG